MARNSPHDSGCDLPEVVSPVQDPRTAPIVDPDDGLESYYTQEYSAQGWSASLGGTATRDEEAHAGIPPFSELRGSKYTAKEHSPATTETQDPKTPFWTRRKLWTAVVVGLLVVIGVIGVVVGTLVGTQGRGDGASGDGERSPTSTSDDDLTATSAANTAFGTPTSFPPSLTGSDSACTGTVCGATLALADPIGDHADPNARLILFARGNGGAYHYREADAGGWKDDWKSLGGNFESEPAVATSSSGRLHIFGVHEGLSMQFKTYRAGSWDATWTSLNGECFSPPTVCGSDDGAIVVMTLTENREFAAKRFHDGDWSEWWDVHAPGGYLASNPVTACVGGESHVVAFGNERESPHELMMKRSNGGRFGDWNVAGGDFSADPVVFVDSDDTFSVFGLGAEDGLLYHATWSGRNASSIEGGGSPRRVGGPSFMSLPSVIRNRKGQIDMLAVDRNGVLRKAALKKDSTLGEDDWENLGGFFNSAPAARLTANDTVSVFGIGPNRTIIHGRWRVSEDGKWTDGQWFDDGGEFDTRWFREGPA